jgi:hypothetical protein
MKKPEWEIIPRWDLVGVYARLLHHCAARRNWEGNYAGLEFTKGESGFDCMYCGKTPPKEIQVAFKLLGMG